MIRQKILKKAGISKLSTAWDDIGETAVKSFDEAWEGSGGTTSFKNISEGPKTREFSREQLFGSAPQNLDKQLEMGADEGYDKYMKRLHRIAENPRHFGEGTSLMAKRKATREMGGTLNE